MKPMNPEIKKRWLEALRSGKFKQGRGQLRDSRDQLCCLGVLCELAVQDGVIPEAQLDEGFYKYMSEGLAHYLYPPQSVADWAGLPQTNPRAVSTNQALSVLNDGRHYTFAHIADIIEKEF